MTRPLSTGTPDHPGVTLEGDGVNVAVFSAHAERIELCLFDADGGTEQERIALPERTGDVFHGHLAGVPAGTRYGLRAHGPYDPHAGHRFNPAKLLIDPHARALDRPFRLESAMYGYTLGDTAADLSRSDIDSAFVMPKGIVVAPAARPESWGRIAWADTIIYELHVRGYSKRNPAVDPVQRGTFAGLGSPASIAHLVKLGVTSVEVMPCAAWIDERHLVALGLRNYWGYNPAAFLAPDLDLAPGGFAEIRAAVAALHRAGIEVIVDIVLNHTGEGDELGPTLSLRGLDNASYYRLRPDDRRYYVDDMGCGNCVALDRPAGVALGMDTLRAWVTETGVDGFRFDLGPALGRRDTGFDPAAPLLSAIDQDPVLRDCRMIVEPWDIGPGGYQLGRFPTRFGEWNDQYRDAVRQFWRGDRGIGGTVATRLAGSSDLFGAKRRPSRSINFVSAHDGFTLADVTAYTDKHNASNGEDNRDGTGDNRSWNHGTEGPSDDAGVREARARDQRNMLATLLVSRGTPMLGMGSELGTSQRGNNNAYAQDNETTWLDWGQGVPGLDAFVARLTALRREHVALRADRFLTGTPAPGESVADVTWTGADGRAIEGGTWSDHGLDTIVMTPFDAEHDDRVAVVLHRGGDTTIALPEPRDGFAWSIGADSAEILSGVVAETNTIPIAGRSVVVLTEVVASQGWKRRRPADPALLETLAAAAGIAANWWDIHGNGHVVPDETKQSFLAGMGVPAWSNEDIHESLAELAATREHRPLPRALVRRENRAVLLRLAGAPFASTRLTIEMDTGQSMTVDVDGANAQVVTETALDGRPVSAVVVNLPPLPIGHHRVTRADAPDAFCMLTIAPATCFMPDRLRGGRAFGVAAQLYALKRSGDQGIGDFSTLTTLATRAGHEGASIIGLNPLHTLFAAQRERASPYHPSDRRFLDPIYIDVTALGDLPASPRADALLASNAGQLVTLRDAPSVDYTGVWALKQQVLIARFEAFDAYVATCPQAPVAQAFALFVGERGEPLRRLAIFQTLAETYPDTTWLSWPSDFHDPRGPAVAAFGDEHAERLRYYMFLQWVADRQLGLAADAAGKAGVSIGFYRDLAVGTAPDGAEAWSHSNNLARGAMVGAPPDPFSASGQNWHLPPINPLALERSDFRPFIEPIAANMRHAGALRIDHVMGLARLFWVPNGAKATEGAYVAYPIEDMIGHLALESQRSRCLVVGEDLGTVPAGFRERLAEADILSYRLLWFEREGAGFIPPRSYPVKAVSCVSTHDLPTLAGWWEGADVTEKRALDLLDDAGRDAAMVERSAEKRQLLGALDAADITYPAPDFAAPLSDALAAAVHDFLSEAPCLITLAQTDDLAGETVGVNLPGTDRERPNWRRKLAPGIDEMFAQPMAQAILDRLRASRGAVA